MQHSKPMIEWHLDYFLGLYVVQFVQKYVFYYFGKLYWENNVISRDQ